MRKLLALSLLVSLLSSWHWASGRPNNICRVLADERGWKDARKAYKRWDCRLILVLRLFIVNRPCVTKPERKTARRRALNGLPLRLVTLRPLTKRGLTTKHWPTIRPARRYGR